MHTIVNMRGHFHGTRVQERLIGGEWSPSSPHGANPNLESYSYGHCDISPVAGPILVRGHRLTRRQARSSSLCTEKSVRWRFLAGAIALQAPAPHHQSPLNVRTCNHIFSFRLIIDVPFIGVVFGGYCACLAILGEVPNSTLPGQASPPVSFYGDLRSVQYLWQLRSLAYYPIALAI